MEEEQQGSNVCPFREKSHGRSLTMRPRDAYSTGGEGKSRVEWPRVPCYGEDMCWGWWAWGVRDMTAVYQNTRRIAPTWQLAHGVAECASREQQ